jgi:glutamyl-tRNA reductase
MIFSSSLQLLEWLQQEDLRQRSAEMRRSAAELRRRSLERFAAALAQVAT